MLALEPISVSVESLNVMTLLPMSVAIIGGLFIIILDLFKKNLDKSFYAMITITVLLMDLCAIFGQDVGQRGFFDMVLIDGISILGQVTVVLGSLVMIPFALRAKGKETHEYKYPEYFALFLFMAAGFQFMVSSDNLIMIFVGLETSSLALYTLVAMHNTKYSYEAAVKYFTMGAMAAGFFLMGSAVIYATTGSVSITEVSRIFQSQLLQDGFMQGAIGGAILMLVAIGFKVSLFPFHTWAPDVYEGSSAPMAGYMSVIPKLAMMVVAMRVLGLYINFDVETISYLIIIVAAVTMTLANMMALVQEDVKRMLAYSSISHAGFAMAALALGTTEGDSSIFLYYFLFIATNIGAFAMLWISRDDKNRHHDRYNHPFKKFSGLITRSPIAAVAMGIFMLSLAGVPPFSLFWGKLYLIRSVVDYGAETEEIKYIILAIIMVLNSAIAAYYYLKLIVYMFLKPAIDGEKYAIYSKYSKSMVSIVGLLLLATVFAIFYVQPVTEFVVKMVSASGY